MQGKRQKDLVTSKIPNTYYKIRGHEKNLFRKTENGNKALDVNLGLRVIDILQYDGHSLSKILALRKHGHIPVQEILAS